MRKIKLIKKTWKAWCIDAQSHEGHGLIGKYWWFEGRASQFPIQTEGYLPAMFKTRKEARESIKCTRRSYPKSKVVRVTIDVSVEV